MPVKVERESKIQFFGEVDLNDDGKITSDMPAWYLERHIEFMAEDIARKETALKHNRIVEEQVPMVREEIKQEKAKLKAITESKPKLTPGQESSCWKTYESLGNQIKDSMPTRKESKDGLVNPHEELKRLKSKHIKISPEMASALGVKPDHGKISGDEAAKCFQILGKTLGENTNVERLRKDGGHPSYEAINDLTKAILEGKEIRE